jgi:23S rRNA (guanosine2251-2'-O)-methyltransferase
MILFALENLRSVHNVASIFRTADGFGIDKLLLIGTTPTPYDRYGNKRSDFAKVALGAEDSVEWEYFPDTETALTTYLGAVIYAFELTKTALPLTDITRTIVPEEYNIIFVGAEVDGVSPEAIAASKKVFQIPMCGMKESFNVSIAAALCMYELKRKKA